jgi:hypothetical protein
MLDFDLEVDVAVIDEVVSCSSRVAPRVVPKEICMGIIAY